jgi:hypothetical protein
MAIGLHWLCDGLALWLLLCGGLALGWAGVDSFASPELYLAPCFLNLTSVGFNCEFPKPEAITPRLA